MSQKPRHEKEDRTEKNGEKQDPDECLKYEFAKGYLPRVNPKEEEID